MSLEEATTYILVWRTNPGNVCRKCLALNGYMWTRPNLHGYLDAPGLGFVYDLDNQVSLIHPNCHCSVDVEDITIDEMELQIG